MKYAFRIKNIKRYLKDHVSYIFERMPINKRYIFLESFDGRSQECNPLAIYQALRNDPRRKNLKFIWSYRDSKSPNIDGKGTVWVKHNSLKYRLFLSVSKIIISNSTLPDFFSKKDSQIYINTWHGVPLKKMGYHNELDFFGIRNVTRNFHSTDILLSGSPWMSKKIWNEAYKLENIFTGKIAEIGTPRIDELIGARKTESRAELRTKLGIQAHDKRHVILYAPTWVGKSPHSQNKGEQNSRSEISKLQELFDHEKYILLVKTHHFLKPASSGSTQQSFNISQFTTNELMLIADQLITDQSSIFFDYLALDRPIHFYVSSLIDQDETRGIYFPRPELPGSYSTKADQVVLAVERSHANPELHATLRSAWREEFLPNEDGRSTARISQIIFDSISENNYSKFPVNISESKESKKKLLIHVGSLIPNGITTAAINLVNALCELGYDVTIFYPYSNDPSKQRFMRMFDQRARHVPRVGSILLPVTARRMYRRFLQGGGWNAKKVNPNIINSIFEREWKRCFGNAKFDAVIAFDGYSVFWAQLLLSGQQKSNAIWLHNDLVLDAARTINGKRPHEKNLKSLFTMYRNFEKLVSVSEGLNEVNKMKMSDYAAQQKFVSVRNLINYEQVLAKSLEQPEDLIIHSGPSFVTVGRLSPEKNQALAIRAFAKLLLKHPTASLTIIGDGPLRNSLEELVEKLDIKDSVIFLGHKANPHPYVKNSDFFVFPSLYEGQGLAMLDALVLGKPVVATKFDIAESVLGSGNGIIVEFSVSDLADGMNHLVTGPEIIVQFNPKIHNQLAINEVESLIKSIMRVENEK